MTLTDRFLSELALKMFGFLRDTSPDSANFASILADLRTEYATDKSHHSRSRRRIERYSAVARRCATNRHVSCAFDTLSSELQDSIWRNVASRGVTNTQLVVDAGEFFSYADASDI